MAVTLDYATCLKHGIKIQGSSKALGVLVVVDGKTGPVDPPLPTTSTNYGYQNEEDERAAYLTCINEDVALASILEKERKDFVPCRRFGKDAERALKEKEKETKKVKTRKWKPKPARKGSAPSDQICARRFSPGSSSSALGRLFTKLTTGRQDEPDDGYQRIRLMSLNIRRKPSRQDSTEDKNEEDSVGDVGEVKQGSYYTDPEGFINTIRAHLRAEPNELEQNLLEEDSKKHDYIVASRNAENVTISVQKNDSSTVATIGAEYLSRLTCYDAMPRKAEVIALDIRLPFEKAITVLQDHHWPQAVMWDSSVGGGRSCGVADLKNLLCHFWSQYETRASSNLHKLLLKPVGEYYVSQIEPRHLPAELCSFSLLEVAAKFCGGMQKCDMSLTQKQQHYYAVPLRNEETGDLEHILTSADVLRLLCKEICKFGLASIFDAVHIHDIQINTNFVDQQQSILSPDTSLRDAIKKFVTGDNVGHALPVYDGTVFRTVLTLFDIVDFLTRTEWSELTLNMCVGALLTTGFSKPKKQLLKLKTSTSLSSFLQHYALWAKERDNGLEPVALLVNDDGVEIGFLECEDLLNAILSWNEKGAQCVKERVGHTVFTCVLNNERRDSGVGEEISFFDDHLMSPNIAVA